MRFDGFSFGRTSAAVLMGMALSSLTAMAQSSGSPYEPDLRQILVEGKVELDDIKPIDDGFKSLLPPGAEFRFRVGNWDPPSRTFRFSFFVAPGGSPLPSVQLRDSASPSMIYQGRGRAESTYYTKNGNGPVLGFAGRVAVSQGGVAAPSLGDVFMLSISYPAEAFNAGGSGPTTFRSLFLLIPGETNFYIRDAMGSITVTAAAP
jgi:hypothetical protein